MDLNFLEHLCTELVQPDCERSAILAALSDDALKTVYVDVLHQFGLELICGLDSHSHWMSDSLLICTNLGPIHGAAIVFYAILCEMDRRGVDEPDVA